MAKIARKLTDLVGNTPLMELSGYSGKYGLEQNIIAKLEAFNPAGSIKDRVALSMIEDAEARGALKPGATIANPTPVFPLVGSIIVAPGFNGSHY
jgi:cysteine synthase A